jgi:hypothetical protein
MATLVRSLLAAAVMLAGAAGPVQAAACSDLLPGHSYACDVSGGGTTTLDFTAGLSDAEILNLSIICACDSSGTVGVHVRPSAGRGLSDPVPRDGQRQRQDRQGQPDDARRG